MDMRPQDILVLANLGFYSGEAANDPEFASELAFLADVYCNDAFAIATRALASTVGITRFVPTRVAGLEMARIIALIEAVMTEPEDPFVALVGGTRLEKKVPLLDRIVGKANRLFIGGALSFTFLKAQGGEPGADPVDEELLPVVKGLIAKAANRTEILLPEDFLCVHEDDWESLENGGAGNWTPPFETIPAAELHRPLVPVDVGPATLRRIDALIGQARTLLWNGPLGAWEVEPFASGTREVARQILARGSTGGFRGIAFGDSLTRALRSSDLPFEQLRPMLPASEATRQLLTGCPLPAVEALMTETDVALPSAPRRRTILFPVDDSPRSMEIVQQTASLLDADGAEIHLLLVRKRPLALARWAGPQEQRRREIRQRLAGERILASLNAVLARHGVIAHKWAMVEGDPARCICEYAEQIGADLIVLGCRWLAGPLRALLHDPFQKIAAHPICPVLLVRVPDEEANLAGEEETHLAQTL